MLSYFVRQLNVHQITDWTGNLLERRYKNYNQQFGTGQHYSYFHEEDESSFQVHLSSVDIPVTLILVSVLLL